MSYLEFHLVFILPPIVLLALAAIHKQIFSNPKYLLSLAGMAVVALVYTTPWDNYLIWRGIWAYGTERVIGTIGYVPIEEYLFFLLQPLLTGLWLYNLPGNPMPGPPRRNEPLTNRIGATVGLLLALAGVVCLFFQRTLYLGLIVAWSFPVVAGQWFLAGARFLEHRSRWIFGISIPTLYLWVTDRYAIGAGIWAISDRYTTGFHLFGLPIEEAVFFLVTNILVVQGLIMLAFEKSPGLRVSP